jgi:SAM-dependent methyltransferase
MTARDDAFAAIRRTEMNEWVGGGDPALVGLFSGDVLQRLSTIGPRSRVVDFGCGIGRVAVQLLSREQPPRGYLGIDIIPSAIDFCRAEIQPRFAGTAFELAAGDNDHYDRHIDRTGVARDTASLTAQYGDRFTHAFAFSVFTHLYAEDFVAALRFIAALIGAGGEFLFTAFTLTDFSRAMIATGQTEYPLGRHEFREDGRVMVGDPADPLAFIAYDRAMIEAMVWKAGLVITKVESGSWMGGRLGTSLQDVYVCRKPRRTRMTA